MDFLHYGLQRSGINYLKQLLFLNFEEVDISNDGFYRSLPVHKHFRLYDEKTIIPTGPSFINNFHYPSISSFDSHVERITGRIDVLNYVVIVKKPFSWYLSVRKEARKASWPTYQKRGLNPNFLIDYSLFYGKWLSFKQEAPERVLIVNYEDLLLEFPSTLQMIADHFGLTAKGEAFQNTRKVFNSKRFTEKWERYYRNKEYLEDFDPKSLFLLAHNLDQDVVEKLGYRLPEGLG